MSMLQGAAGAVIGLLGLFAVFWLTHLAEQRRQATAAKADRSQAWENRRADLAVDVVDATFPFSRNQLTPTEREEVCDRVCIALLRLSTHVRSGPTEYADAGRWLVEESKRFRDGAGDVAWEAGVLGALLPRWLVKPDLDLRKAMDSIRKDRAAKKEKAARDATALGDVEASAPDAGDDTDER